MAAAREAALDRRERVAVRRTTPLKRGPMRRRRRSREASSDLRALDRRLATEWGEYARRRACVGCGARTRLQGHHAVKRQYLAQLCVDRALDGARRLYLLWDLRNCCAVCETCHANHHSFTRRLPRAAVLHACPELPAMLDELGAGWLFDREYPESEGARS